jgi:hypothetical protein
VGSCRLKFHNGFSDNSLKLQSFELVQSRAVSDIVTVCLHVIANAHNITGCSLPRHHVHHSQRGYHKSPTCQPAHVQATRLIHLWAPLYQAGSPSHSPLRAYPHKSNACIQCHKHTEQHKAFIANPVTGSKMLWCTYGVWKCIPILLHRHSILCRRSNDLQTDCFRERYHVEGQAAPSSLMMLGAYAYMLGPTTWHSFSRCV